MLFVQAVDKPVYPLYKLTSILKKSNCYLWIIFLLVFQEGIYTPFYDIQMWFFINSLFNPHKAGFMLECLLVLVSDCV